MTSLFRSALIAAAGATLCAASWYTFGGDKARSGYNTEESVLSTDSVKDLKLEWKFQTNEKPRELDTLTAPIEINPVYTNKGAMTYVVVGGANDDLFTIDADSGKLVWSKHFENNVPAPAARPGFYFCPDALNDTPVINWGKNGPSVYVISTDGKLHALALITGEDRFAPVQFVPPYSKNWSLNFDNGFVYTTVSQNCHGLKNGVYAIDVNSDDKKPVFFEVGPGGGGIWGRGGAAIGPDGTIYASTGDGTPNPDAGKYSDTVLALQPKTLKVLDYYLPQNAAYVTRKDLDIGNTTPAVFTYKGRTLVVAAGKEGVLTLLDAKSLGGDTHRKPLYQTSRLANDAQDISGMGFWGAFATFEDGQGNRWLYAPEWGPVSAEAAKFPVTNGATTDGSLMAFKVEEQNGQPALVPAWISGNMRVPEPPVIANGVVFVLSSGEFTRQISDTGEVLTTDQRRSKNPGHAILYALDAKTGKELWNSGNTITSFTHLGGIAVSDGRVFVTTWDGTVYAFGIPGQ